MSSDVGLENLDADGRATLERIKAQAHRNRREYVAVKIERARQQPKPPAVPVKTEVLVKPKRHRRNKRKPVKFFNPADRD